jgi:hypothetical protein
VQFIQDPAFHLLRGLVRKGHGQDVPVQFRIRDNQADKITCQGVRFPRTC